MMTLGISRDTYVHYCVVNGVEYVYDLKTDRIEEYKHLDLIGYGQISRVYCETKQMWCNVSGTGYFYKKKTVLAEKDLPKPEEFKYVPINYK